MHTCGVCGMLLGERVSLIDRNVVDEVRLRPQQIISSCSLCGGTFSQSALGLSEQMFKASETKIKAAGR